MKTNKPTFLDQIVCMLPIPKIGTRAAERVIFNSVNTELAGIDFQGKEELISKTVKSRVRGLRTAAYLGIAVATTTAYYLHTLYQVIQS